MQASQAYTDSGPWVNISRLGNPLINEVMHPARRKDRWNRSAPAGDSGFAANYESPELSNLLPVLYPGAFPNLAAYNATKTTRADIVAILLTGIPTGVVSPGFQNYTGKVQADQLRLNVAIPPPPSRARWVSSAAMWRASRTAAGYSTTSSRSKCEPSPEPRSRWWTSPSRPTAR